MLAVRAGVSQTLKTAVKWWHNRFTFTITDLVNVLECLTTAGRTTNSLQLIIISSSSTNVHRCQAWAHMRSNLPLALSLSSNFLHLVMHLVLSPFNFQQTYFSCDAQSIILLMAVVMCTLWIPQSGMPYGKPLLYIRINGCLLKHFTGNPPVRTLYGNSHPRSYPSRTLGLAQLENQHYIHHVNYKTGHGIIAASGRNRTGVRNGHGWTFSTTGRVQVRTTLPVECSTVYCDRSIFCRILWRTADVMNIVMLMMYLAQMCQLIIIRCLWWCDDDDLMNDGVCFGGELWLRQRDNEIGKN